MILNPDLLLVVSKLYTFGHFNRILAVRGKDGKPDWYKILKASRDTILAAIESYEKFHALPAQARVAGTAIVASDALYKALTTPRCGFPDLILDGEEAKARWQFLDVAYWNGIEIPGLKPEMIEAAYDQAWDQWRAVCGLKPRRVLDRNQANVWAHAGRIDRAGSILAWSYMPGSGARNESLEQLYDTADAASYAIFNFILAVTCHEIGHAIGLPHGPGGRCLMGPYVNQSMFKPQLIYDIPESVARYDVASTDPLPPPPPPPIDPRPSFASVGVF